MQNKFINRELSWLEFNRRVLEEADNINNPLLERLKFLSISGSNLDEFFMVRVAGLKGQVDSNVITETIDGKIPFDNLVEVIKKSKTLKKEQDSCLKNLLSALTAKNINVISNHNISLKNKRWLQKYFLGRM